MFFFSLNVGVNIFIKRISQLAAYSKPPFEALHNSMIEDSILFAEVEEGVKDVHDANQDNSTCWRRNTMGIVQSFRKSY